MRWDRNYKQEEQINDPQIIPAYGVTDVERAYWNAKQEALEYDRYPTLRSDKHCTSGVIHRALEDYKTQAVELSQAFFWGQVSGLGELKEACEVAAVSSADSKLAAETAQGLAESSKNTAVLSAQQASESKQLAEIAKNNAQFAAVQADNDRMDAEAWAVGTREGVPVEPDDPAYHNNSKYYADLGSEVIQDDIVTQYTTWSSNKLSTIFTAKADLVSGKVPAAQLPSFVDDVEEYASLSAFPVTGESGKLYIALDTNKTYRWSGSTYVEVSESLALGETSSTAYAGDKGKANADAITDINSKIPSTASSSNKLATNDDLPTALEDLTDDITHRTVTDLEKTDWNSKAAGNHTHDDRYYTETETDTLLAGKAAAVHNHDDRYYTEAEVDALFGGVTFSTSGGDIYINW